MKNLEGKMSKIILMGICRNVKCNAKVEALLDLTLWHIPNKVLFEISAARLIVSFAQNLKNHLYCHMLEQYLPQNLCPIFFSLQSIGRKGCMNGAFLVDSFFKNTFSPLPLNCPRSTCF